MRSFLVLLKKEIRSILLAPATWLVAAAFAFSQAFAFILSLRTYQNGPVPYDLVFLHFNLHPMLFWLPFLFLFPLITMRSFAEEERQGTIEPLMTAPVRTISVVAAKFFAAYGFYILLWLPTALFFLLFQQITGQSPMHGINAAQSYLGGFWGATLILALFGAAFISVGCFCSAITGNQLAAAVITFIILLLHLALGSLILVYDDLPSFTRNILQYINSTDHLQRFTQGKIELSTITYYLSVAVAMFYLTHRTFDFRRWQR